MINLKYFPTAAIISYINSYYYWELRLCNLKILIIIYYLFIIKIFNLFIFDKSTTAAIISYIIGNFVYFQRNIKINEVPREIIKINEVPRKNKLR